jgi:acylphosphatase
MTTASVLIIGFVKGVGFRQFIKRNAIRLGITGWVKNTQGNRVEAMFTGQKEKLEEMIKLCRKGPFLADVKRVDVEWEQSAGNFETFEIAL